MSTDVATPRRWVNRLLLPVLFALGVLMILGSFWLPLPSLTVPSVQKMEAFQVPDFDQVERHGQRVTRQDLLGKVWVASFIFTRCSGPCPSVTATLARLQKDLNLAEREDLRLVSFTIDPERDSADDLKKYADRFQAHPTRWLFLRGPEATQLELATKGFKVLATRSQDAQPKPGQEFDHSTKLALVDRHGRIHAYFDGYAGQHDVNGEAFEKSYSRLKEQVELMLKD